MSKKKRRRTDKAPFPLAVSTHNFGIPSQQQEQLLSLYDRDAAQAAKYAEQLVSEYPLNAFPWKVMGNSRLKLGEYEQALQALERADSLTPNDALIANSQAVAHHALGDHERALSLQKRCVELAPEYARGHFNLAQQLNEAGDFEGALRHLDEAERLGFDKAQILHHRVSIQSLNFKFDDGLHSLKELLKLTPESASTHTNCGNYYKDMAELELAEQHYSKALELAPDYVTAYSNLVLCMHYDPKRTHQQIVDIAKQWESRFSPIQKNSERIMADTTANKPLRLGLVSSGFRSHPVGQMISAALQHLPDELKLYIYSGDRANDAITERIRKASTVWHTVPHLNDRQLAEKIREDGIDILIDLAGHGHGSRLRSACMRPAPLIVKWVGMQISTTGISAFDYFLSDSIETPPGVDPWYVEKIIRMPDDYICYLPPPYMPAIAALPAISNRYITLGCFNNPAKVNNVLLVEWAKLMHELPNSRLLLKGAQYSSPEVCTRIRSVMGEQGIASERLILEGPSRHQELLDTYNRVDIALDPWPYSGGLTTCEAMLMGVPVVTFPGPTFAGRHSATHLVNAGMPELVVDSWDEYRQRVIELATDLPNLSVIRACLRRALIESPVCDGLRFARHFTTAMRAIWQRHCEGKDPAALSLGKDGSARFDGEDTPEALMPLAQAPAETSSEDSTFQWGIEGKIITLDHGAILTSDPIFAKLQETHGFATITFDPTSKVTNAAQLQQATGELHYYPQVALGDGHESILFSCINPAMSATLEPLPAEQQLPKNKETTQIISKLSIPTLRLNEIEGLENIDWLLLDNMNDSLKILEYGTKAIFNTLLVQARVNFTPSHRNQTSLSQISDCLALHGFKLYQLNNLSHTSYLPKRDDWANQKASQLAWADALFLPNEQRMMELSDNQRLKLAFLLNQAYGVKDLTYRLLAEVNQKSANDYLYKEGLLTQFESPQGSHHNQRDGVTEVSVICATYNHRNYIEDAIKGILAQKTNFKFQVIIHDDASVDGTQEIIAHYANKHPELIKTILQIENQYSQNRKPLDICLPKAEGRYIAICEGDDYWTDPEKLQKQYDFMESNPEYSCCYHDAFIFNESGIVSKSKLPERYRRDYTRSELLLNNCFILTLSIFFKKSFTEFPIEKGKVVNGDNFLISMLGLHGNGKYLNNITKAAYRIHENSTWSSKNLKEKNEILHNSFTWIAHYHNREGRTEVADYYKKKAAHLIN